jgi:hypothetical protein
MMRYFLAPQWPFNSSAGTYQSPLEWIFTAGRLVWDLMQVLKIGIASSVKATYLRSRTSDFRRKQKGKTD